MILRPDPGAPYSDFAARLIKLRNEAGMTRNQLGEYCGVAPSTIVNYEKGTRIPYADTAVKMAQCFNMTVEELLGMENPEQAMQEAEVMDMTRSVGGSRSVARLRSLYNNMAADFAGGDVTDEQAREMAMEVAKLNLLVSQHLTELHTNKKYQKAVEEKAARTTEAVKVIDEQIAAMTSDGD